MENVDTGMVMGTVSKLVGMGTPGLIALALIAFAAGAFFIWKSSCAFKKQVKKAEVDTAESAASANQTMDDTDSMGDAFLNGGPRNSDEM